VDIRLYKRLPALTTFAAAITTIATVATITARAAEAAATVAAASTAAGTVFTRTSHVNVKRTAIQFLTVKTCDSRIAFRLIRHFYKAETARIAAILILNDVDSGNLAESLERLTQFLVDCCAGKIADINVHANTPYFVYLLTIVF
jgi:hypothetical protein